MSICPASGFFIEETPGDQKHGNFQVLRVSVKDMAD
jgi:hypothetical protein